MSKVTEPMLLDKTGQQLLGAMTKQNELLTAIASGYNYKPTSIADVFAVVQSGKANQVFNYFTMDRQGNRKNIRVSA